MRDKKKLNKSFAVLVLAFVLFGSQFNVFAQDDLPVLELRKPIEEKMEFGKTKSFQVTLDKNKYAYIASEQLGANSFVRVYAPNGEMILERKNFIERWKTNRVLLVAETAGNYKIEIIPNGQKNKPGKFKVTLVDVRDATSQDQFLLEAQKTILEAETLHSQRKVESLKQAIAKYEESLQYWQKSGDLLGQADVYSYSGIALYSAGKMSESLEKLQQARNFYNKAGEPLAEAAAFRGVGLVYHVTGELDKALESYKKGLEINRRGKNVFGEANDLGNIGGVYQYRGEYQQAIDYYRQALALARKLADKQNEARLLNNIGWVYSLLSENEKALEYLKDSLKLRKTLNLKRGEGNTLNNLALVYLSRKNYQSAIEHFDLSLRIRRKIGDIRGESVSLNNIGFAKYKLGDYSKALEMLNQAALLRKKSKNPRGEAATSFILGLVHQALNNTDKAAIFYQEALGSSRKTQYRQTEAVALMSLANIELEKKNIEKAGEMLQQAIKIIESIRTGIETRSLRTSFLGSDAYQSVYKSYIRLLMEKHKLEPHKGFDKEALKVYEKTRARNLLELLSESKVEITKGIDSSLVNRRNKIQIQINVKERQRAGLLGRNGAEKQIEAVEKDLSKLLEQHEEIKTEIRVKNPNYAELINPKSLEIKEIQNLLDKNSFLLEYSLGEKQSFVWVVGKDSVKSYALPNKEKINDAAKYLYDLLTKRNQPAKGLSAEESQKKITEADKKFDQAASKLSKMIVPPFVGNLDGKRLIVVSEGYLQYVPFGALTKSTSNSETRYKPLILDHEIVSLPSASTLAVLRDRVDDVTTIPNSVAVIADPVFSESDSRVAQSIALQKSKLKPQKVKLSIKPDESVLGELKRSAGDLSINEFRRLRFSRREANDIASFASKEKQLKAVDFAAGRDLFLKEDLSKYQILHFATHGLLNNKNPELSGIVLSLVDENGKAKDGFLRLHDIYNMKIGADLVVLSACQTALGKDVRGEGLIGLTRGFMYAGAESVVASLWQVEDRATAELMKKFYRAMLKDGLKPAAALRMAKVEMIKEDRWGNPYYWAAFTLQGEWK